MDMVNPSVRMPLLNSMCIAYAVCAVLMLLWTVEKNLPEEQKAIAERKK